MQVAGTNTNRGLDLCTVWRVRQSHAPEWAGRALRSINGVGFSVGELRNPPGLEKHPTRHGELFPDKVVKSAYSCDSRPCCAAGGRSAWGPWKAMAQHVEAKVRGGLWIRGSRPTLGYFGQAV